MDCDGSVVTSGVTSPNPEGGVILITARGTGSRNPGTPQRG